MLRGMKSKKSVERCGNLSMWLSVKVTIWHYCLGLLRQKVMNISFLYVGMGFEYPSANS